MKCPTEKSNYTKNDLVNYANYRKKKEFESIEKVENKLSQNNIDVIDKGDEPIERESLEEYREPLEITENKIFNILLSTGGDSDGFKIEIQNEGDVVGGVYYWANWGVYEEVILTQEEAQRVAEYYSINI